MFIEMKVSGLALDPFAGMPIVILKDLKDENALPIWIGLFEASAIATQIEDIKPPRPITHDLLINTLDKMNVGITRIEITHLENDTFFASIYLKPPEGDEIVIDSRPSDAIALALRAQSPIYVAEEVIEKSRTIDLTQQKSLDFSKESKDKWAELLKDMSPEDFGKYKM